MILPDGYQQLVQGAGYHVDHGAGQFEATGADAVACVNRVVTADLSQLPSGRGTHTLLLRDDGSILARLTLYRFVDRILLHTESGTRDDVWHELVARKRGQVRLRDISDDTTLVQVRGPRAAALLTPRIVPLPAEAGVIDAARCGGTQLFAAHVFPDGPDGFDLHCRRREEKLLFSSLGDAGLVRVDDAAWETLRVEWGTPAVGVEIDPDDTPLEAGLEDLVREGKGAPFPGEFAVASRRRTGPIKRLVGIRIAGDSLPPAGASVQVNHHEVGRLRSVVESPRAGMIGIVAVPTSATSPGTAVVISVGVQQWTAEVVRRPFVSRSVA